MVATVVLLFLPLIMLLTVDCVTPLMVHNLLTDKLRSSHNAREMVRYAERRGVTATNLAKGIEE
jgi:hypothetical protein